MSNRVHVIREAVVKITQLLAGKKIKVTQRGVKAFVESDTRTGQIKRINLPFIPDDASDEFLEALQGYLDHEVGHILFSDFKEIGRGVELGVGDIHNMIEDPRIEKCMANEFRGSGYNLRRVSEFVLNNRIAPGVEQALKVGNLQAAQQALVLPVIRSLAGQQVHTDFLNSINDALWRPIIDELEDLRPKFESMSSTKDALELAVEVTKRFKSAGEPPPPSDGDSGEDESEGGEGDSESGNGSSGKKDGKRDKDDKGDDTGSGDDAKDDANGDQKPGDKKDDKDGKDSKGDDGDSSGSGSGSGGDQDGDESEDDADAGDGSGSGEGESSDASGEEDDSVGGPGSSASEDRSEKSSESKERKLDLTIDVSAIPSFDDELAELISIKAREYADKAEYSIYTKDFDTIQILQAQNDWLPKVKKLEDRVDHMVGPLQKELERIMAARSAVVWAGGQRRGRLHGAGLTRLTFGDDRVFRKREESRSKEWAVEILVDMSGSMGQRDKIVLACDAAYACAAVFERMRIKCEVIAFTTGANRGFDVADFRKCSDLDPAKIRAVPSWLPGGELAAGGYSRYEPLFMPILKTYDERMTPEVKSRFAGLPAYGHRANNVDGECVEIAALRLMTRREAGKLLIVLSDGHPHAAGNSDEQASHLKRVVKKIASSKQIKLFAVGINDTAVQRFYPDHVVLRDISKLPETMMHELKRLIFS
ncbi:hypothetical protein PQQ87_08175 [Paraburkholderia nemoris]|uniref:cobaltochelatase CobT-related protein n=1 Tax=Paraburkholderia nemoris TaxID=2793076 RepID=UPI0038B8B261